MQVYGKRDLFMKAQELRNESVQELRSKLKASRGKMLYLRFQHSMGSLKNPLEIRALKRDMAKIITVIKEKENEKE